MKKVLFMLSSMNIGGVEKSLLSLLSKIPQDEYEITLLLLEKKGGFIPYVPDWIKVEEVNWFKDVKPIIIEAPQKTINNYKRKKQFSRMVAYIYTYILSEKLLKNRYIYYKNVFKVIPNHHEKYDIAISYQGPTDTIDYYIANRVKAKRKITWIHFDVSKHQINPKLYKKLYKRFDKIFVVSREAKEKLIEKIPSVSDKAEVFMNIVSEQLIEKMSKKKVNFDKDYRGIRIVTVGRLAPEKGQDLAIKVLYKLRQNGYEVRWYCIGEGKQRKEYEQLIERYGLKDEFILLGSTPNPYPFIKGSDIYVQTSKHEGYCLTLAEARSLNKPIITTNFTGVKEQIKNNKTGLIVDIDEKEIYEALLELINKPKRRQEFSNNLSKENFDDSIEKEGITSLFS